MRDWKGREEVRGGRGEEREMRGECKGGKNESREGMGAWVKGWGEGRGTGWGKGMGEQHAIPLSRPLSCCIRVNDPLFHYFLRAGEAGQRSVCLFLSVLFNT